MSLPILQATLTLMNQSDDTVIKFVSPQAQARLVALQARRHGQEWSGETVMPAAVVCNRVFSRRATELCNLRSAAVGAQAATPCLGVAQMGQHTGAVSDRRGR